MFDHIKFQYKRLFIAFDFNYEKDYNINFFITFIE